MLSEIQMGEVRLHKANSQMNKEILFNVFIRSLGLVSSVNAVLYVNQTRFIINWDRRDLIKSTLCAAIATTTQLLPALFQRIILSPSVFILLSSCYALDGTTIL